MTTLFSKDVTLSVLATSLPIQILHPDIQKLIEERNDVVRSESYVMVHMNSYYFFIYLQSKDGKTWNRLDIELQ